MNPSQIHSVHILSLGASEGSHLGKRAGRKENAQILQVCRLQRPMGTCTGRPETPRGFTRADVKESGGECSLGTNM